MIVGTIADWGIRTPLGNHDTNTWGDWLLSPFRERDLYYELSAGVGLESVMPWLRWNIVEPTRYHHDKHWRDNLDHYLTGTRWNPPQYWWQWIELSVASCLAHRLEPVIKIKGAPDWAMAEGVDMALEFGRFCFSVAYLFPQVRYFIIDNEMWSDYNLEQNDQAIALMPELEWFAKRMIPAKIGIKLANPDALVSGGDCDTPENFRRLLDTEMLGAPVFDFLGFHPYGPDPVARAEEFLAIDDPLSRPRWITEFSPRAQDGFVEIPARAAEVERFLTAAEDWPVERIYYYRMGRHGNAGATGIVDDPNDLGIFGPHGETGPISETLKAMLT